MPDPKPAWFKPRPDGCTAEIECAMEDNTKVQVLIGFLSVQDVADQTLIANRCNEIAVARRKCEDPEAMKKLNEDLFAANATYHVMTIRAAVRSWGFKGRDGKPLPVLKDVKDEEAWAILAQIPDPHKVRIEKGVELLGGV